MDVLVDTNILIHRESDDVVPEPLRDLERDLREAGHRILAHPASVREIYQDPDDERRESAESRVDAYPRLEFPPKPGSGDSEFRKAVSPASNPNDQVDNQLLYAVFEGTVDFLITQDKGIHRKALDLGIEEQVFNIDDGREYFLEDRPVIHGPAAIQRTTFSELDLEDPIFDSLKEEYSEFVSWAKAHEERPTWVNYTDDGTLGALLVIKPEETEEIGVDPPLERDSRMKISTLKVGEQRHGSKVGELFISIAVREAIHGGLDKIYLTHFEKPEDYLVDLIDRYGFERVSQKSDGEAIFQKRLTPPLGADLSPVELAQQYYPSFYDGSNVRKFLVPVKPQFHNKLFTGYPDRDPPEDERHGDFRPEGNAIRKAYLSNANTRKIEAGDLLLFYRSNDHQKVTSLGICEEIHYRITDTDEVSRIVGKRSVFSEREIDEYTERETTVLLFLWHFDLENPLSYHEMLEANVLSGPPQVMQELDEQAYKYVRENGGIDGRFARN